jgi:hypothetical protein
VLPYIIAFWASFTGVALIVLALRVRGLRRYEGRRVA